MRQSVLWLNYEVQTTSLFIELLSYGCYECEMHYPGMNKTGVRKQL